MRCSTLRLPLHLIGERRMRFSRVDALCLPHAPRPRRPQQRPGLAANDVLAQDIGETGFAVYPRGSFSRWRSDDDNGAGSVHGVLYRRPEVFSHGEHMRIEDIQRLRMLLQQLADLRLQRFCEAAICAASERKTLSVMAVKPPWQATEGRRRSPSTGSPDCLDWPATAAALPPPWPSIRENAGDEARRKSSR